MDDDLSFPTERFVFHSDLITKSSNGRKVIYLDFLLSP